MCVRSTKYHFSSFSINIHFVISRAAGRIKRLKLIVSTSNSNDTSSLKSIGGRINRVPHENNVGGSIAASMSATAKFRRERSRVLNTLETDGSKIKSIPSIVTIPIVVEESNPDDLESTQKEETKIREKEEQFQILPYATALTIGGLVIGFGASII